jgi:HSP20 family protein
MADIRDIRWQQFRGQLGQVAYALSHIQIGRITPTATWAPAINAYRCEKGFHIFVDLAGIRKEEVDVHVEPSRVLIRGTRKSPEPRPGQSEALQVLAMEIDYGIFERELVFSEEVDPPRVSAEQKDGMLEIILPLRPQA